MGIADRDHLTSNVEQAEGIGDSGRAATEPQRAVDNATAVEFGIMDGFQKTAVQTVVEDHRDSARHQMSVRSVEAKSGCFVPPASCSAAIGAQPGNSAAQRSQLGIGWRPELAVAIERRNDLEFVEIVAENFSLKSLPEPLMDLRRRGLDVIPHGISLSLGGAQLPDIHRIRHLNDLAVRFDSPFVSEHIAFVRAANLDSGHLLPVPRTERAARVLVDNISFAKEHLDVPLVLENVAYLCEWKNSEMDEAQFVRYILEETDSMMLLDVANLLANSINHDFDAAAYLRNIPLERIAYVHVAGGILRGGLYHDTHAHPVPSKVLELLRTLAQLRLPPRVMLERDDHFPMAEVLNAELDAIKDAVSVVPLTGLWSALPEPAYGEAGKAVGSDASCDAPVVLCPGGSPAISYAEVGKGVGCDGSCNVSPVVLCSAGGSPAPEHADESSTGIWSAGGSPAPEHADESSTGICSAGGSPAPEHADESSTGIWSADGSPTISYAEVGVGCDSSCNGSPVVLCTAGILPAPEHAEYKPVVEATHPGFAALTKSRLVRHFILDNGANPMKPALREEATC